MITIIISFWAWKKQQMTAPSVGESSITRLDCLRLYPYGSLRYMWIHGIAIGHDWSDHKLRPSSIHHIFTSPVTQTWTCLTYLPHQTGAEGDEVGDILTT